MITTGIIRQINLSSGNYKYNKYKVELNIFQIPGDLNSDNYTYEANCMTLSGFSSIYDVGDKVYVGFLNSDKSIPIILGKIYQGISDEAKCYASLQDLKVSNSAVLPKDIVIGDYSYQSIHDKFNKLNLIDLDELVKKEDFDKLLERVAKLEEALLHNN